MPSNKQCQQKHHQCTTLYEYHLHTQKVERKEEITSDNRSTNFIQENNRSPELAEKQKKMLDCVSGRVSSRDRTWNRLIFSQIHYHCVNEVSTQLSQHYCHTLISGFILGWKNVFFYLHKTHLGHLVRAYLGCPGPP